MKPLIKETPKSRQARLQVAADIKLRSTVWSPNGDIKCTRKARRTWKKVWRYND